MWSGISKICVNPDAVLARLQLSVFCFSCFSRFSCFEVWGFGCGWVWRRNFGNLRESDAILARLHLSIFRVFSGFLVFFGLGLWLPWIGGVGGFGFDIF